VIPVNAQATRLLTRSPAMVLSWPMRIVNMFTYEWIHFVIERGMLLGIQSRAEGTVEANAVSLGLAHLGWTIASVAMVVLLFARRRGWWWGLLPLSYAGLIIAFTGDLWSALAGFLWWGIIVAGFLVYRRGWWKGLVLATALVLLTLILVPQSYVVFGLAFGVLALMRGVWAFSGTRRRTWTAFCA
jgi:hypothetical protein